MLDRFLSRYDVDPVQWRAILKAAIKRDLRMQSRMLPGGQKKQSNPLQGLIPVALFYVLAGFFSMFVVLLNDDIAFTGTTLITVLMLIGGTSMLVEFNAIIISPDDFHILSYRPVSSRTFFTAKVANIIVYVSFISALYSLFPFGALLFAHGFQPALAIASFVILLFSGIYAALALTVMYSLMIGFINPKAIQHAMGYVQMALSIAVYGGSYVFSTFLDKGFLREARLPDSVFLFLFPPWWFECWVEAITGHISPGILTGMVISILSFWIMMRIASGRLSIVYAERLERMAATEDARNKAIKGNKVKPFICSTLFATNEARSVVVLVRNQFKYDQKFRMAIFAIIPLTGLYLLMGLRHGTLGDPFLQPLVHLKNASMLYVANFLGLFMINNALTRSDSYQAAWIFFTSPCDKGTVVLSMKNVVVLYFLLPYQILLAGIFAYFFSTLLHVAIHVAVLFLLTHITFQLLLLTSPKLPFSMPVKKGERTAKIFGVIFGSMIAMSSILPLVMYFCYPSTLITTGVIATLAVITILMERALRRGIHRRISRIEFLESS